MLLLSMIDSVTVSILFYKTHSQKYKRKIMFREKQKINLDNTCSPQTFIIYHWEELEILILLDKLKAYLFSPAFM